MESRFSVMLKKMILEEIDRQSASIVTGGIGSYDGYKYMVGLIAGMKTCIGICEELEKERDI